MKRSGKSGFSPVALQHIYHRAKDKGVIFYTLEDRLVYYTLAATKTKASGAVIYAASFMFTHIHMGGTFPSLEEMSCCLRDIDTSFARMYNLRYGRKGRLFEKEPGSSQKTYPKQQRSCVIYVFNNHVEKGLCENAEQERWSFLAYAFSDHPFSEEVNTKTMSETLRKAFRLVDRRVAKNAPLKYEDLDRILPHLDGTETGQFADYVISRYALINYDTAINMFGTIEKLREAVNSTTGSDFDIKEDFSGPVDTPYVTLCRLGKLEGWLGRAHSMPGDEKFARIMQLQHIRGMTNEILKRFFHLEFKVIRR